MGADYRLIAIIDAILEPEELAEDGSIGEESVSDLILTWYRENGFARVVSPQGSLDRLVILVEAIEARGARRGREGREPVSGHGGMVGWTAKAHVWNDPSRPHKTRVEALIARHDGGTMPEFAEAIEAEIAAAEARGRNHAFDAVDAGHGAIVGASGGASAPIAPARKLAFEAAAEGERVVINHHDGTTETVEPFDPVAIHDRITQIADDRLGLQVPGTTALAMLDALDARHTEVRLDVVKAERLAEKLANGLAGVLTAITSAEAAGCIEHLDAWDDVAVAWHQPIERARVALNKWEASNV